jgi:hypothetical protein
MQETYETKGPRCPYCQHLHQPDEPFYWSEETTDMECEHCDRGFEMELFVSYSWTCRPTTQQESPTNGK